MLEGTQFQFTKEEEWYRKEDHQGVNSCLVVEGIPSKDRGPGGFEFAKVLEVHAGPVVVAAVGGLRLQDGNGVSRPLRRNDTGRRRTARRPVSVHLC